MTAASPDASSAYPHLFSPLTLRGARLRNRVVHASMSTRYAADGAVTQQLIDYHANRARGGAAMLVTETMNLTPGQRSPHKVFVRRERNRAGLERWAEAVRAHGSHLLGQVQDPGRGRHRPGRNQSAIAPSALPDDLSWTMPRALTTADTEHLIEEFSLGARVLRDAGFSGVEISAGHGHLFHQFLAESSNRRSDRFGGDLAGRCRILTELLAALRDACGADFVIGVKLPGEDGMRGGIDLATAAAITRLVHATGEADYLTWCWGAHSDTLDWHLPDMHGPRLPYLERIVALAREAPGTAIGALGLVTDPNEGERIVRDGLADLVMLGRPLVTDAAWAEKARGGRESSIRYCVSCNACWGAINAGQQLACDNNPRTGRADETSPLPAAARRRRIVVVGAGIAGMEAAWVAAARGHDVTVFCAGAEPGGKTRLHARLPGGESLSSIYDYQALRAAGHGVRIEHGLRAGLDDCLALSPDAVVLATGSIPLWPGYVPEELRDPAFFPDARVLAAALLERRGGREPGTALLYDQDHTAFTYALAELLQQRFERVVLATPRPGLAADEPLVNRLGIYRRLYRKGIDVRVLSEPCIDDALADGIVRLRHVLDDRRAELSDVALVAHATPRVPDDALAAPLRARGIEVFAVGDCDVPGAVLGATRSGHEIGEAL